MMEWKKCSSCKSPIALGEQYYACSVSTCNSLRTGYVFCDVACFERHVPGARHTNAAAIEMFAPKSLTPQKRIVPSAATAVSQESAEVLVIASRMKDYVQARADMNTSADVMSVLSDQLRVLCDRAIDNARAAGRKTLMGRDFDFLKKADR